VPGITFAPAFIVSQDSHCQRDGPGGLAGALLAARRASRGSRFMLILLAGEREREGGEGEVKEEEGRERHAPAMSAGAFVAAATPRCTLE